MRPVIIHYHLFKNAGTSVDEMLRENFASTWAGYEGGEGRFTSDQVAGYLRENPWISVLSSHRAELPLPKVDGVKVFPILFVRHPIDRARSVYEFERKQDADTEGARAAKEKSFPEFVEWRLDRNDRALANFQAWRLARGSQGSDPAQQALETLASLRFIGVVERFDASVDALQSHLGVLFPQVRLRPRHANRTSATDDMEARIAKVREMLGEELFKRLCDANDLDFMVWRAALSRYE